MRFRLGQALALGLTAGIGLVTLMGLLFANDDLGLAENYNVDIDALRSFTDLILQVTTITIALTVLLGVFNLLLVHIRRLSGRQKGMIYSLVLLASFALVVLTYVVERDSSMVLLETVQVSVESALAGLLFFALVYGAYGILRQQITWPRILFVIVLLIVLIGTLPIDGLGIITDMRDWLMDIPVNAGARGLLMGIALATLVTGVRVLIGVDRSYRE